ncbi:hypothetical protein BKH46_08500 [Helicobacter sp. 12S02634-8]|uniref:YigZ family protein n=1 Tax=Helicobacter sp. 12S02634-8 TaxID=1476199 RepID=UPI000BA54661|nr:YigZ family protein [Helicobacter sp. 12S02634-8]PAF46209.1 hypothetical protein BKH46_08500 [Helicobacter sp. 12S02634-8]
MNTISEIVCGEFVSKGSKFLAFLMPYRCFDTGLADLKKTHLKAVHFVYAYRFFDGVRVCEGFSDDGEPRGSSGRPVLNVLRGEELVDVGVVVVRYFGGVLLGVGGLVRAYSKSVLLSIQTAKDAGAMGVFEICENISLECPYALLGRVEYLAKKMGLALEKEGFLEKSVRLKLFGNVQNTQDFLAIYKQDLVFE